MHTSIKIMVATITASLAVSASAQTTTCNRDYYGTVTCQTAQAPTGLTTAQLDYARPQAPAQAAPTLNFMEYNLRRRELALRERELRLREREAEAQSNQ